MLILKYVFYLFLVPLLGLFEGGLYLFLHLLVEFEQAGSLGLTLGQSLLYGYQLLLVVGVRDLNLELQVL